MLKIGKITSRLRPTGLKKDALNNGGCKQFTHVMLFIIGAHHINANMRNGPSDKLSTVAVRAEQLLPSR